MSPTAPAGSSNRRAEGGLFALLLDRVRAWRSGVIAEPAFRRFAARNLLTRRTARRQTTALFDLVAGFVYSQTLLAFVRLDLPERLAAAPRSTGEIAALGTMPAERADILLRAAASLGLAEARSDGRWGLGPLGAALVRNDGVRAMIEHNALLYEDLADQLALLRNADPTRLSRFWTYGEKNGKEAPAYSRLMAASQDFVAAEVLDAVRLEGPLRLLDIGGGSGAFAEEAVRRHGDLSVTVFDLPEVIAQAKARLAARGLAGRIGTHAGSFRAGTLPTGFDVTTLVRVLHDHDDDVVTDLLAAVRRSLEPGKRLIVAEPMAGTPGGERAADAYFGFYLTAMRSGRPRSFEQIEAMLKQAGFASVREARTATPQLVRVAEATV